MKLQNIKTLLIYILFFACLFGISDLYDKHYCKVNGSDYYHSCK